MRALATDPPDDQRLLLRARHTRGDEQIAALWQAQRALAYSQDDLCFTPEQLGRIRARTLVYYGDHDPLYPTSMARELVHSIPGAELELVSGGHSPVFLEASHHFAARSLAFLTS